MALYVTRLQIHSLDGVARPFPTSLLYGDNNWETSLAELFCNLRPHRTITWNPLLVLELGWFDYHRALSYGALLCNVKIMAKAGDLYVG